LTATVTKDSTWTGGLCRSFKIANAGTTSSRSWKLTFTLPSSVKITDSWSGSATRSGNLVTVTAPSWAASVAPGASVAAFGFCASGSGEPSAISVSEVALTGASVATLTTKARARAVARARTEQKLKIQQARRNSARAGR